MITFFEYYYSKKENDSKLMSEILIFLSSFHKDVLFWSNLIKTNSFWEWDLLYDYDESSFQCWWSW